MNRELIFLGMLLVLCSGFVNAYVVGQSVTQTQLDNFDLTTFNFNISQDSAVKDFNKSVYSFSFGLDSLDKTGVNYVIVRKTINYNYSFSRYLNCRAKYDSVYCVSLAKRDIIRFVKGRREAERRKLLSWQNIDLSLINELVIDSNYQELN